MIQCDVGNNVCKNTVIYLDTYEFKMERVSRVYIRIHYLSELSRANVRDRLSMIRSMNRAQIECLKIIASQIVGGRMLLLGE